MKKLTPRTLTRDDSLLPPGSTPWRLVDVPLTLRQRVYEYLLSRDDEPETAEDERTPAA